MSVLTGTTLKLVDHRLLWWLLRAQVRDENGVGTGVVAAGWRAAAQRDLNVADSSTILKAQQRLKRAGIIDGERWGKEIRLRGEAFE